MYNKKTKKTWKGQTIYNDKKINSITYHCISHVLNYRHKLKNYLIPTLVPKIDIAERSFMMSQANQFLFNMRLGSTLCIPKQHIVNQLNIVVYLCLLPIIWRIYGKENVYCDEYYRPSY